MRCPRCQTENREGRRFCAKCGSSLPFACPSCGSANEAGESFCGGCGQPFGVAPRPSPAPRFVSPDAYTPKHLAEKILTSRSALEGERKHVTVLFCDIANSTALAEHLGPEVMHRLLNRFFELAMSEVHRYEGTVNQFLGDGFMALFGAPLAHEDHARLAVLAALGVARGLQEHGADFERSPGEEMAVRMGLNTGPVVVGRIGDDLRMDYTAVGDTTNLAFRLQQMAEPGIILLGEATFRLVKGDVRVEAMAPLQVKGKDEAVSAYKVLGLGPRRSPVETLGTRALSRFVGRERELTSLLELVDRVESGRGEAVGIQGEPGVGKSRLLYEFRRRLMGRRLTYLEGHCVSYGAAIPYLPVLDIFRQNCAIAESDSPDVIAEKVSGALREVAMEPDEWAPYLLQLLGMKGGTDRLTLMTPETLKARTFDTILQLCLKGSRQRPSVFVVEDLHWVDRTSEEFFATLVDSFAGAPILLLTSYRPGYRPPWMNKSYVTQVVLHPLSPGDSLTMLQSVVRSEKALEPVTKAILDKAEGNPFFLEELVRTMGDPGALRQTPVPDTIQGVLMARIDRLPEAAKRLLQTASVLGREVPYTLLAGIWEGPEDIKASLRELTRLEFLYERALADERVYVFKHALTQEVAYESLLLSHRQRLHAAAGQALERLYSERLDEAADRLAYHYSKTAEADKALVYLTRVARKAARGHSHVEAIGALQEALAHAARLPIEERDRRILALILRQVQSLNFLGRNAESLELLLAQRDRVERLTDPSRTAQYHFSLGLTYIFLGDEEQATQILEQALAEATRSGDERTMGMAYALLTLERYRSGDSLQAIELGGQALLLLERTLQPYWLAQAHYYLAITYFLMGELKSALDAAAQARMIGDAMADRAVQSYAASAVGAVQALAGDWEQSIEACRSGLELAPNPLVRAHAMAYLGYAHLENRDPAEAIPLLARAAKQLDHFRYRQPQGIFTILLGEAYLLDGQIAQAREAVTEGLEVSRSINYRFGIAWGQRALGRIAWAMGRISEAQESLGQARASFDAIHARLEAARTRLDLARLAHSGGDQAGAATQLGEAGELFASLQLPKYVERTAALARQLVTPI